jgi:hypothetical protein
LYLYVPAIYAYADSNCNRDCYADSDGNAATYSHPEASGYPGTASIA